MKWIKAKLKPILQINKNKDVMELTKYEKIQFMQIENNLYDSILHMAFVDNLAILARLKV